MLIVKWNTLFRVSKGISVPTNTKYITNFTNYAPYILV